MTAGVSGRPAPPRSLAAGVPAVLLAGDQAGGLVAGIDEMFARFFEILDDLDSYWDPRLAPDGLLPWLAGWLGLAVAEGTTPAALRGRFAAAADALLSAGTRRGIESAVEASTGVRPRLDESGGVKVAASPGNRLPGAERPFLEVVVPADAGVDLDLVDRVVAACKPVHIPHRVSAGRS